MNLPPQQNLSPCRSQFWPVLPLGDPKATSSSTFRRMTTPGGSVTVLLRHWGRVAALVPVPRDTRRCWQCLEGARRTSPLWGCGRR